MRLRKLVSRILVTLVALGLCSISAFSQTRPRTLHPVNDANDISCSPEDYALAVNVTEPKPVWEAKPKPTIDLAPSTGSTIPVFLNINQHSCQRSKSVSARRIAGEPLVQIVSTVRDLSGASSRRPASISNGPALALCFHGSKRLPQERNTSLARSCSSVAWHTSALSQTRMVSITPRDTTALSIQSLTIIGPSGLMDFVACRSQVSQTSYPPLRRVTDPLLTNTTFSFRYEK